MSRAEEARKLSKEIAVASQSIRWDVIMGTRPDPEDFVVLRGSTEALIELAENAPSG